MNWPTSQPCGSWEKVRVLGSGGFGAVMLWKNTGNSQEIALKECRLLDDQITEKMRRRWTLEVDIMTRLHHENVVFGISLPDDLRALTSELPFMAIEYCRGGDLRRVLIKPENCCGLQWKEALRIATHISAAVDYLHSCRIVHRDLKPENIVLQTSGEGFMYKLIDLGYAKELDQGSICNSFVGTLHYLAPELMSGQKYTCTVDYWSLGLTVFETVTGKRPFLCNLSPVQVLSTIAQKRREHICAYQDVAGEVVFSERLCYAHRLPPRAQRRVEAWLALMLDVDPATRGGGVGDDGRRRCFPLLAEVAGVRVARVRDLGSGAAWEYEVDEGTTLTQLRAWIARDAGACGDARRLLLLPGGRRVRDDANVGELCTTLHDDRTLFLLPADFPEERLPATAAPRIPEPVAAATDDAATPLRYSDAKRCWTHAVMFCQGRVDDYAEMAAGEGAAVADLASVGAAFAHDLREVVEGATVLRTLLRVFCAAAQADVGACRRACGDAGPAAAWEAAMLATQPFTALVDRANDLHRRAAALDERHCMLRQMAPQWQSHLAALTAIKGAAAEAYERLRGVPREQRAARSMDARDAARVVAACADRWRHCVDELRAHLSRVAACGRGVRDARPQLEATRRDLAAACSTLDARQRERQRDIWDLVTRCISTAAAPRPSGGLSNGVADTATRGSEGDLSVQGGRSAQGKQRRGIEDLRTDVDSGSATPDAFFAHGTREVSTTLACSETAHTELEKMFVQLQVNKERSEECDWSFMNQQHK
ncbi:PREDICTED: inhibitor of nuclear factor kappa-B kinase subunit alpha-like [Priapulus caudatus]|uniref:IkappaB kinase n=1 Tax=Priapulus caudatus TaxID=37621 RepID=A0ABM1EPS2_PRICU|nr:PREDICTED: inhibitor of nuclear factor kappa-B kinase subunit alpha-like [Priapulus caudatus]